VLEVDRALGVSEAWVFRGGASRGHRLDADEYVVPTGSAVLADLDLVLLARHVTLGTNLTAAVRAFREALAEAR
jgi:hypothetical protein